MIYWLVIIHEIATVMPTPYTSLMECQAAVSVISKEVNKFNTVALCVPAPTRAGTVDPNG